MYDFLFNVIYVGFIGMFIDVILDVFGEVVDVYIMIELVKDGIIVKIVYEGRVVKVLLDNSKLKDIEGYYVWCVEEGFNEY